MKARRTAMSIAASGAACLLSAAAVAAPIDCSKAQFEVEQRICAHADLLAKDGAISDRLAVLGRQCPAQKGLLVQGQKFWLRERWDCRNGEGALEANGTLAACLAQRMDQRLQALNDVGQSCDLSSLTATYRFIDTGYLRQFSRAYVGKPVAVFAWMDMDACRKAGEPSTTGSIVGVGGSARFPVRFSAMPALRLEFLCANQPAAHWKGIVRDDGKGAYLYLTDLLGEPLEQ